MQALIFATGNNEKFAIGRDACRPHGIELSQQAVHGEEIQSEDLEKIIRFKAGHAYRVLQQPVIVSDDGWHVPALNGFPGAYMKSIDHWFTPQNWLDLMRNVEDRRIILVQHLAFQDAAGCQIFRTEFTGQLLTEARGTYGKPLQKVITMPGDNGLSVAEAYDRDTQGKDRKVGEGWRSFAEWYSGRYESAR
jgi:XTP/dITP diphosphohydrolase